jgi:hypothetical protein
MSHKVVLLRIFPNEPAAIIARAILEANDIPSILSTDGARGMEPQLAFVQGVRLSVRESDVAAANELLDAPGLELV